MRHHPNSRQKDFVLAPHYALCIYLIIPTRVFHQYIHQTRAYQACSTRDKNIAAIQLRPRKGQRGNLQQIFTICHWEIFVCKTITSSILLSRCASKPSRFQCFLLDVFLRTWHNVHLTISHLCNQGTRSHTIHDTPTFCLFMHFQDLP